MTQHNERSPRITCDGHHFYLSLPSAKADSDLWHTVKIPVGKHEGLVSILRRREQAQFHERTIATPASPTQAMIDAFQAGAEERAKQAAIEEAAKYNINLDDIQL